MSLSSKKVVYVLSLTLGIAVVLTAYQNCGSDLSSARISSSQASAPLVPKEIIVRMKSDSQNEVFKSWATSNGLILENDWSDMLMTHWS